MRKNTGIFLLCALMALAIVLSGCSVVRGEVGTVDVEQPAGEPETSDSLAPVDEIHVIIMESLPARAAAIVRGHLPDGCTSIVDMRMEIREDTGSFHVTLGTYRDPEAVCTMALVPYEEAIELPILGLLAGTYTVEVNGLMTTFELAVDNLPLEG